MTLCVSPHSFSLQAPDASLSDSQASCEEVEEEKVEDEEVRLSRWDLIFNV